ncbi:MAG: tetratricopeptide repeat protein [Actinomycetales bacterium]|nr:tetratricopeptide repeat protein [Actinomycetales bacterium]
MVPASGAGDSTGDDQAHSRQRAPTLLDVGRQLLDEGCYEDAARALRRRLRLSPEDARARFLLGVALLKGGDPLGASTELSMLPSPEPLDGTTCYDVGVALLELGETHQAREWLSRALAADPRMPGARDRLLECRPATGSWSRERPRTSAGRRSLLNRMRKRGA